MTRPPTSPRHLRPAALKDGRYGEPYALLEVEQLWCGLREVWTASHGRATAYHVMGDGGMAACRSKPKQPRCWQANSIIVLGQLIPITKVPSHMGCLRNGCRQVYEAFLAGHSRNSRASTRSA